jgi:hypothetical protein
MYLVPHIVAHSIWIGVSLRAMYRCEVNRLARLTYPPVIVGQGESSHDALVRTA